MPPMNNQPKIRVAILDLYEGQPNQGMRCLREILDQYGLDHGLELTRDEFEVRLENKVPHLSYDIYISSGGPRSPLESENSVWENNYFQWLAGLERYNESASIRKHVLFICHSFQLACRYYDIAEITLRKSTAFGVFPVHLQEDGKREPVFAMQP